MVNKKEKLLLKLTELSFSNIIFSLGILIVIISGILITSQDIQQIIFATLIIIGITMGLFCINKKKNTEFLIASILIIITMAPIISIGIQSNTQQIYNISIFTYLIQALVKSMTISQPIINIANFFTALILPASIVVSLKSIFNTTHTKEK